MEENGSKENVERFKRFVTKIGKYKEGKAQNVFIFSSTVSDSARDTV